MDISGDIAFVSFANGDKDKVSVCAKDLSTGEVMMTYMGGACARGTLNLIGSRYLMAADEHKSTIYLWALNKKDPIKRIKAVGKISCLSVNKSSSFCVGSVDERMYVWMVPTGTLARTIAYHCTRITCVRFSTSGLDFVSCDKHGSVALWNVNRIMSCDSKTIQPVMTFTGHTAKVTDAHLNEMYLVTSSLDKTVRIWHLRTGEQNRCLDFDGAVTSVSMSPGLGHVLVGWNEARLSLIDVSVETRKQDVTFITNSDVVCMSWTTEGALLYGDERGTVGLLRSDMVYSDELFTHKAAITNILLAPFLPYGWNDSSKPCFLDIVPLSEKLCEVPDHLGVPINCHEVTASQTRENYISVEDEFVPEQKCNKDCSSDDEKSDPKKTGSNPMVAVVNDIKAKYAGVLKNLLLK